MGVVDDPRWNDALEMLIAGVPKTQIARRLDCHRNTINAWMKRPEFVREMQRRLDERDATARLRRSHQATAYADRVHRIAHAVLTAAEAKPLDRGTRAAVRFWMRAYRRVVAIEARLASER